jgi:hypothetical protein
MAETGEMMNYYILFLEIGDKVVPGTETHKLLMELKKRLKLVVVNTTEENYDFLYNSLIEKARAEEKR